MGVIHVLDPHVVNQIAAGEVIERPASVVKELVENALDAGARRIDVRLEEGGCAAIEVADDGAGMDAEDVGLALRPHATSKVRSVDDLQHVASLGFRGEALASIGSVARVTLVSRPAASGTGWAVVDEDGRLGPVAPTAAAPGTVVRVEGLFRHVPARRKFLRSPATELGHVVTQMGRFALAFPDVAFRLRQGAKTLLEAAAGEDRRARIAGVHGHEVGRALVRAEGAAAGLALEAWVGPPSLHRADGRLEQAYLNGRFVRDRTVAHATRLAYEGLLPPGGRRPVAFLFLACDPGQVDVNVHPAKAEVRWRSPDAVHHLVRATLRRLLEGMAPGVPLALGGAGVPASTRQAAEFAFTHPPRALWPRGPGGAAATGAGWVAEPAAAAPPEEAHALASPPRVQGLRPIGQALGTYLVLEGDDAIVLVDQHALHERVLHDQIAARLAGGGALEVQRLLVPAVVHLDPAEVAALGEVPELLATLGWHVEPFGTDAVAVHGVPALLRSPDPERALADVLAALAEGPADGLDRARVLHRAIDRLACRAAVMAGDRLHGEEVLALLEAAEALDHAHSCPHGRPTRLTLPRAELERWFNRTG